MSEPEENPGRRLRAWALKKYGNLSEAAVDLGIDLSVLSRHAAGQRQPSEGWKARYAQVSEGECPVSMWPQAKSGPMRHPSRQVILAIYDSTEDRYTVRLDGCGHERFVPAGYLHAKMVCTLCKPVGQQQSKAVAT